MLLAGCKLPGTVHCQIWALLEAWCLRGSFKFALSREQCRNLWVTGWLSLTCVLCLMRVVCTTVTVTALQGLTQVFDDVVFVDCPSLRSLAGLGSLGSLGRDLVLRNLKSLTSTTGMANITQVGESLSEPCLQGGTQPQPAQGACRM